MQTLREFLANQRQWTGESDNRHEAVLQRLGHLVGDVASPLWVQTLAVFVLERPWRYWDLETVTLALELLERDPTRSAAAFAHWEAQLGRGFDALFLRSEAALSDDRPRMYHVREIVRLGTLYHPEYLRYAEHVFGNLLPAFWAVQRKGSVDAKYDLPRAVGELRRSGFAKLTEGFEDRIRNAIAHGEITFRGTAIRYGPQIANYEIEPSGFVSTFDNLVRTTNALAIAMLVFWARNHDLMKRRAVHLPVRLLGFISAVAVDSLFVTFEGAYESESALAGRQLHVGLATRLAKREFVLLAAATVGYQLLEFGATDYERFLIEVLYENSRIEGLVVVDPRVLGQLLEENAPDNKIGEIFVDVPLLWTTEGAWRTRVRVFSTIAKARYRTAIAEYHRERNRLRGIQPHSGFWVRGFDDVSVGGLRRAEIHVVLRNPQDAGDRNRLKEIAYSAINEARRKWVKRRVGEIGSERGWRTHPQQVSVKVYRADGPLRWMTSGGWRGGNLVLIAERTPKAVRRYKHVFVPHPDEVWRGIRIQYGMSPHFAHLWNNDEPAP